jgi:hypothetical protein
MQLHRLSLRRLHQDAAARRKIQEGFLGCGSEQDDQGLWRADRRCGCRKDRGLSHRELLKIAGGRRRGRPRSAHLFCNDTRFPARRRGRFPVIPATEKLEPAPISPRQMRAKSAKRRKCGAIWHIFAETTITFALPSPPQPAYPEASGMPGMCGDRRLVLFFDSAETT